MSLTRAWSSDKAWNIWRELLTGDECAGRCGVGGAGAEPRGLVAPDGRDTQAAAEESAGVESLLGAGVLDLRATETTRVGISVRIYIFMNTFNAIRAVLRHSPMHMCECMQRTIHRLERNSPGTA